jgi:hypothetical protein
VSDSMAQPPAADLRAASDMLMHRLERLSELERRKRELPPDQPEFMRLAREIEDVARGVLGATGLQVELAAQVAVAAKRGDPTAQEPIREVPPNARDAVTILGEWRAAERRLAAAALGSDEERIARADVDRLRIEYRQRLEGAPDRSTEAS